jgi:AcrR family transcriptional regulator
MARPLSISDEGILAAAERVMASHGPHGFSVSEVAREVGLTRAAITMRFHSAESLKNLLIENTVKKFEDRIGSVSLEHGAKGLVGVAVLLSNSLRDRAQFANFWTRHNAYISDPVLVNMELRRSAALRSLIASVMPETAVDKDAAVVAYKAYLIGCMLNWQSTDYDDPVAFMTERAIIWLRLAGIVAPDFSVSSLESAAA